MNNEKIINMEVVKQLKNQAMINVQTLENIEMMYNEMLNMSDEVKNVKIDMLELKDDIVQMKKDIEDNVHITYQQMNNLKSSMAKRSNAIAKIAYGLDENTDWNTLSKAIGKVRMKLWSLVKQEFKVTSYSYIPRKDYERAENFISELTYHDFVNYCGKHGIPELA